MLSSILTLAKFTGKTALGRAFLALRGSIIDWVIIIRQASVVIIDRLVVIDLAAVIRPTIYASIADYGFFLFIGQDTFSAYAFLSWGADIALLTVGSLDAPRNLVADLPVVITDDRTTRQTTLKGITSFLSITGAIIVTH
jgi:hypothetical protein